MCSKNVYILGWLFKVAKTLEIWGYLLNLSLIAQNTWLSAKCTISNKQLLMRRNYVKLSSQLYVVSLIWLTFGLASRFHFNWTQKNEHQMIPTVKTQICQCLCIYNLHAFFVSLPRKQTSYQGSINFYKQENCAIWNPNFFATFPDSANICNLFG